ncbi:MULTISPECIES: outer membrane lipoprotein chaperone LolA [Pseudoalteromonas]|uniref:Outer-membrane lipoprotein carrier protein n=1 Tax=Pseudoalteromonas obscura TaxID=3048491 RepID=A0ABT7EEC9_9GAMM|nr:MULTISPECIES: outer membrane lipoprotein chaperone LolA [Pseudoalteromonas]MBQ4838591.1 outer membrane lipoprotein chaperone LolA [Pseudoalteromonas luteoviolacea]MDK2593636.1 outer membrane lipoprotein chaperone LolA [Pseudoalteromonas sp. P94(2023)]
MKFKTIALVLGLSCGFVSQSFANEAESLKLKLRSLNTFEASFTQKVKDEEGTLLQDGTGNIALKYPSKIRWQQLEPDETLLVSDGNKTFYFDSFAEQVTVMNTAGLIDTTPFILLTTQDKAQWEKYDVSKTTVGYRISPKPNVESQVELLDIVFASAGVAIDSLSIKDASGQTSTFKFSNAKTNIELDDKSFTFKIPHGVVIDDQTASE